MDKDVAHINNGISLSPKKSPNNTTCSNVNAAKDYHEVTQKENDKCYMLSLTCGV